MAYLRTELQRGFYSFRRFCKWVLIAVLMGTMIGVAGVGFHHVDEYALHLFASNSWLLFLMPLSGVVIIFLYRLCGIQHDRGTNLALLAARGEQEIALRVTPLIGVSTILTHLTGGSVGREGAALQMGGSMGSFLGRKLHLQGAEARMMEMCGMAAGFSALFGTPLASAVFAIEVASVGMMPYAALVHCVVSALAAQQVAMWMGGAATVIRLEGVPAVCWQSILGVVLLGCLCGLLSWVESFFLAGVHALYQRKIPNPYLCVAVGGCLVVVLSLLLGTRDYNGTGIDGVIRAVGGEAVPWAFACKLLFTPLTVGSGFKGGEIVPTFFIGATFGCTVGVLLGLPAGFAAALGTVALFCGVTNAPMASVLLAYEMFEGKALILFALVCAVSYRLSGSRGLYGAQKLVASKELPEPYGNETDAESVPESQGQQETDESAGAEALSTGQEAALQK